MLVENQKVEIKWNNFTKRWYESKGYVFTKNFDTFLVNVEDLTPGCGIKVLVECDYCKNRKEIRYSDYNKKTANGRKYACKNCAGKKQVEYHHDKKKYFQIFLDKCNEFNCIPISTISDYHNSNTKLQYICPRHGLQQTTRSSILAGCWCSLCGHEKGAEKLRKSISEVKDIVESKNNNILLNPEDYINASTSNLKIICGSCNEVFVTSLSSVMSFNGSCSKCGIKKIAGANKLTPDEVKSRIDSINGNILLNPEEYISNSTPNLKIKCGDCGEVYITTLANYEYNQKIRCDSCSQRISVPERRVMTLLDKYNIEYIYNHKFDDCKNIKPLPFDFYLPQYGLIIETDGEHHFRPIWGDKHFSQTKQNDSTKNEYCKTHNIELIRIPYWDFDNIEDILIKKLDIPTFLTSHFQRKQLVYKPQINKNTIRKIA